MVPTYWAKKLAAVTELAVSDSPGIPGAVFPIKDAELTGSVAARVRVRASSDEQFIDCNPCSLS